jgi:hypothetical protein
VLAGSGEGDLDGEPRADALFRFDVELSTDGCERVETGSSLLHRNRGEDLIHFVAEGLDRLFFASAVWSPAVVG